jgi:hypothetical protein
MSDELRELVKRWRRRKNRLRRKSMVIGKVKTDANQRFSNIYWGQYEEAEKCANDLVATLNKLKKENGKKEKKTI